MVKEKFNHILVPIDGSEMSTKALDYAIKLSKASEAKLMIVNVIDAEKLGLSAEYADRFSPYYVDKPPSSSVVDRYKYFYAEKLQDMTDENVYNMSVKMVEDAEKYAKGKGVKVEGDIALGPVAQTIVELAEEHKCDLIVIGSRGLTGFKKLLMGHVTCDVSKLAHCPVLVIR